MSKIFIKSFFIYGIVSALGRLSGIFLVPIYARFFSQEQYGVIDLVQTTITILAILGMLQLEGAVQRYYFELKEKDKKNMLSTVLLTLLFLSFLIALFITLFSVPLSNLLFKAPDYSSIIALAAIKIPLFNVFILLTVIIRYSDKPLLFMLAVIGQIILTVASSIVFVIVLKIGIEGVFLGEICGFIIAVIFLFFGLKSNFRLYFSLSILKELFKFSLPQFPSRIASIAQRYTSRFIIISYLTIAQVGIYSVISKVASLFLLLDSALANSWYPYFYKKIKEDNNEIYKMEIIKVLNYLTLFIMVVFLLFSLFSKELIYIIASDKYDSYFRIAIFMSFGYSLEIIRKVINTGHLVVKKTIYGTIIFSITVVVNLILMFILVPKIGLMGVPYSFVVSTIVSFIISWIISEKLNFLGYNKTIITLSLTIGIASALFLTYMNYSFIVKIIIASVLLLIAFTYILMNKKKTINAIWF